MCTFWYPKYSPTRKHLTIHHFRNKTESDDVSIIAIHKNKEKLHLIRSLNKSRFRFLKKKIIPIS